MNLEIEHWCSLTNLNLSKVFLWSRFYYGNLNKSSTLQWRVFAIFNAKLVDGSCISFSSLFFFVLINCICQFLSTIRIKISWNYLSNTNNSKRQKLQLFYSVIRNNYFCLSFVWKNETKSNNVAISRYRDKI